MERSEAHQDTLGDRGAQVVESDSLRQRRLACESNIKVTLDMSLGVSSRGVVERVCSVRKLLLSLHV